MGRIAVGRNCGRSEQVDLNGVPDDPADRLIVTTALHHRAALVMADEKLLAWAHPLIRRDARA